MTYINDMTQQLGLRAHKSIKQQLTKDGELQRAACSLTQLDEPTKLLSYLIGESRLRAA